MVVPAGLFAGVVLAICWRWSSFCRRPMAGCLRKGPKQRAGLDLDGTLSKALAQHPRAVFRQNLLTKPMSGNMLRAADRPLIKAVR
jgi:hypothetical protein